MISDASLDFSADSIGAGGGGPSSLAFLQALIEIVKAINAQSQTITTTSVPVAAADLSNGVTGTGLIVLATAPTLSGLVSFGGSSVSFPALKRSLTTLQVRLADDSAFTALQGKLTTDTAYTAVAPGATGYLTVYDSTGTAYKVLCST